MSIMKFTKESLQAAQTLENALNETVMKERRTFIKKGTLAALAASLPMAGFIKNAFAANNQPRTQATDIETLTAAYTIELQAVNTYSAAAGLKDGSGMPYISGPYLEVALDFVGDHQAHAIRFKEVITQLGGTAPTDPTDTLLSAFPPGPYSNLTSTDGIFKYALALEVTAAKLWFENFKNTSDLRVKTAFADIAPIEASHAAIFRAALKLLVNTPTDHDSSDVGKAIVPFSLISLDSAVL
jgi:rubrerythrin